MTQSGHSLDYVVQQMGTKELGYSVHLTYIFLHMIFDETRINCCYTCLRGLLMQEPKEKGEIMRHAAMLVKTRGDGAVDHAKKMAEMMQETGNEEDQAFWNKIAQQVELLVFENPPDES